MGKNLYVGNLSYGTTEQSLETLFAEFGEIESVRLVTDRYTGRSKGFAFVEMKTEEGAEQAISGLNGREVDGREIKVDVAKPRVGGDRPRGGRQKPRW